jgi:hypothetical protein
VGDNNGLLIQWLSEYIKLDEEVIILVLGSIEDKHIFPFLHSWRTNYTIGWGSIWTQLLAFLHEFFIHWENLLGGYYNSKKSRCVDWCYHLRPHVYWIFVTCFCFCFHELDKRGDYVYFFMSFTNIWVLWVKLWVELAKVWYQTKLGLNSLWKY